LPLGGKGRGALTLIFIFVIAKKVVYSVDLFYNSFIHYQIRRERWVKSGI
jgi:hypothetical protein